MSQTNNNSRQQHQQKQTQQRKRAGSKLSEVLVTVKAIDNDCSERFGSICRYELIQIDQTTQQQQNGLQTSDYLQEPPPPPPPPRLSIDSNGRVRLSSPIKWRDSTTTELVTATTTPLSSSEWHWQVVAYDCGGKKSLAPAKLTLRAAKLCKRSLKGKLWKVTFVES